MKRTLRLFSLWMAAMLSVSYASAQIKDGEATVTQGSTTTVAIGEAYQRTLRQATGVSYTWTTSGSAISIQSRTSTNCTIKGNTAGSAKLYYHCSYYIDGFYRTMDFYYDITIKSNTISVTRVDMSPSSATMKVGETLQLDATAYPTNATNRRLNWTTEDYSVASVSSSGLVTARGAGKVWIWARATDGSGAGNYCVITVEEPVKVETITLSETEHTMKVGDVFTLTASVKPDNASNKAVTWKSDNTDVATVAGGVVKAVSPGTCNVLCLSTDGGNVFAVCQITVEEPEQKWLSVVLPNGSFAVNVTDMPEVGLKITPDDGYAVHSVTMDGEELPVDASGTVLALPALEHSSTVNVVFVSTTPDGIESVSGNTGSPHVTVAGGSVHVHGLPQGESVKVYDQSGALVKITDDDTFSLDGNGVYILRIGGKSFKLAM